MTIFCVLMGFWTLAVFSQNLQNPQNLLFVSSARQPARFTQGVKTEPLGVASHEP